jgi:hypothetical protein
MLYSGKFCNIPRYISQQNKKNKKRNTKKHSDSNRKIFEINIFKMLELLIDNTSVTLDELVYQQTVGIPMGTNCTSSSSRLVLSFNVNFYVYINAWSRSSCIYDFFKLNGIDEINIIINVGMSYWLLCEKTSSIWRYVKIKGGASLVSFFLAKPRYDMTLNESLRQKRWFQYSNC